jgi:nicotinate phosphoribosyltransferase
MARGRDPQRKRLIASDALDVDRILALHAYFGGRIMSGTAEEFRSGADFADAKRWRREPRIRFSSGWGTFLTNDFRNCDPRGEGSFDPISLVCKLTEVEGRPAVKLSDNYAKSMGPAEEVERYRRVFGTEGISNLPVEA